MIRLPVPLMELAKFVPWVTVSERLRVSVPLFTIEALEEMLPVVPPVPTTSVPPLMVVAPV